VRSTHEKNQRVYKLICTIRRRVRRLASVLRTARRWRWVHCLAPSSLAATCCVNGQWCQRQKGKGS